MSILDVAFAAGVVLLILFVLVLTVASYIDAANKARLARRTHEAWNITVLGVLQEKEEEKE